MKGDTTSSNVVTINTPYRAWSFNDNQWSYHNNDIPYVVLLGDVGTGKSTLVEKVTGIKNRSSKSNQSVTKAFSLFKLKDGSLMISDTPGSNPMTDRFDRNLHIAQAMCFKPFNHF